MFRMERVYLVILEDRHTDLQVELYAEKKDALDRAKAIVAEYGFDGPESTPCAEGRCLFDARLSNEGDYVSVREEAVRRP